MAEYLPDVTSDSVCLADNEEELLNECESIWQRMEECQSKLMLLEKETALKSDVKISMLMMQMKALTEEYNQWQNRSPEVICTNPDVLLALGKEELQKVKDDLEVMLSTVKSKNKQLEEDLKREQQWCEEQEHILNGVDRICGEADTKAEELSEQSLTAQAFNEQQNKMLKLRIYKEEILNALGEFIDEHFPLPENGGNAKKKNSSEEPAVELITLQEILEILIKKSVGTPHEPYVTISDIFWPPYIELLDRCGIILRHPEDPKRIRLEAFHM